MDGLGLGPHGPPIPPPATFAVVPYPVRRRPPMGVDPPSHYVFVASSPDDPNAPQEDKVKETEPEVEKPPEKPPVSPSSSVYFLKKLLNIKRQTIAHKIAIQNRSWSQTSFHKFKRETTLHCSVAFVSA